MATAPTYCTHRQLKDVFPQVDSFDNKRPIYGWESESSLNDWSDTNEQVFFTYNTGLATQLFRDGMPLNNLSSNIVEKTQLNGAIGASAGAATVDSASGFEVGDIIRIGDSSYRQISSIISNTLVFGSTHDDHLFRSSSDALASDTSVYLVVDKSVSTEVELGWFFYDSTNDLIVASSMPDTVDGNAVDLNDVLMEAGEDFSTLIARITANASRYLDSKLDPNLPKEQLKDKEGNFDYIIVRTTALIAATFLIRSHDPTSEIATALMEDAMGNIDALNKGGAALSWQTTGDSSKGIIRDVTYTSGKVRPVDLRGRASGVDYDLIKVTISASTAGVIGTAKYNVYVKDNTGLKKNQVVTERVITGDYQTLAYGLEIRFGGSTDTSQAAADDEWEIEVAGWQEEVDNSAINSVRMTRR